MSPGAVAVTRTSWCQCELPTHLCANVPLSCRQGSPNPHSHHPPRAWPEWGGGGMVEAGRRDPPGETDPSS